MTHSRDIILTNWHRIASVEILIPTYQGESFNHEIPTKRESLHFNRFIVDGVLWEDRGIGTYSRFVPLVGWGG